MWRESDETIIVENNIYYEDELAADELDELDVGERGIVQIEMIICEICKICKDFLYYVI